MAATPPSAQETNARASVDRAAAMTEDLIARGAPWGTQATWPLVVAEGIVVAIVGLVFLIKPLGGSSTTLQVVGIILLIGALITTFQLWRRQMRPDIEQLEAFRAGSGVTVGLVVVVATFFTDVTEAVTAALAVAVGIGFFIFGVAGIAGSFVRRTADAPLPLATLVLNAVLGLAGLVLVFAGAAGADAVDGIFNLLGVLIIAAGLGLGGYGYLLYQQDPTRR